MSKKLSVVFLVLLLVSMFSACSATPTVPSGQVFYYRDKNFVPPTVGISTDFVLYDPNKKEDVDAIAKRYSKVYTEGDTFVEVANLPIQKVPYLVVAPTQLAVIDNYILPPGIYYKIPTSQEVKLVNAVVVSNDNNGILFSQNIERGKYSLLTSGIHRALPEMVRYFPNGPQRYRLISADLLAKSQSGDSDACQSALCETTLTNVLTKDPTVRVAIDLEVNFELDFSEGNLSRLYELRDIGTIMRTYFSSPIRTTGRSLWGNIAPADMQTQNGWVQMNQQLKDMLMSAVNGQPINILSVSIRGVELPADYLASQSKGASDEQALQAAMRNGKLSQDATATASAFERDQQKLKTSLVAEQMAVLSTAVGSSDPIVKCSLINVFYPGTCTYPLPVNVTVGQNAAK